MKLILLKVASLKDSNTFAYVLLGEQWLQVERYVHQIAGALLRAALHGQLVGLFELLAAEQVLEKVEHRLLLVLERQFAGLLTSGRILAAAVHQTSGRAQDHWGREESSG